MFEVIQCGPDKTSDWLQKLEIGFASSHSHDPATAMAEVARQLGDAPLAGMLLFCSHRFDRDALAEELRDLLDQSVRARLRSTGRLGAMLSGGLDSSSVVALRMT